MSEDISNKVFRLHILANSDEQFDQDLKLLVRDEILSNSNDIFKNCDSVSDAISVSNDNIQYLNNIANKVIRDNGYNYNSRVFVSKEYFNTRVYDDFTLPAGYYDCLKIIIGEGKGHNWWCVMYPSVCISGCTDDFGKELTDEELSFIKNDRYIVKFKFVEIYEKIKLDIKNKIY